MIGGQPEDQQEFWTPQFWKNYCESANPFRRYKLDRDRSLALELLRPQPGEKILEVGCGYGRISSTLLAHAGIRLVGVDFSKAMLQFCSQRLNGKFMACRADAGRLPFQDESFDGVLCSGVLMHVEDQRRAIMELCRVLRVGGRLIISGNNLLSPYAPLVLPWILVNRKARQVFKTPWFYLTHLRRCGITVRRVVGDTILAVGLLIPGLRVSLLPSSLFRPLRALDRWADRAPLKYLTYETWFEGVKTRQQTP